MALIRTGGGERWVVRAILNEIPGNARYYTIFDTAGQQIAQSATGDGSYTDTDFTITAYFNSITIKTSGDYRVISTSANSMADVDDFSITTPTEVYSNIESGHAIVILQKV